MPRPDPPAPDAPTLKERLDALLQAGDVTGLGQVARGLLAPDVADLVESLDETRERIEFLRALPSELASEALAEMEDGDEQAELLAGLDPAKGAELLEELAHDDAADLIAELEPEDRRRILDVMEEADAAEIEDLLAYGEETAGGIMTTELVTVSGNLTAAEVIGEVRRQGREVEDFYSVFVLDAGDVLLGTVGLDDLILADPAEPVANLVEPPSATILPDLDQEEVGRIISHYNLVSVPVVSASGVLLGRITFDDVIDVIEAEQTEDILRMAGITDEDEIRSDWTESVRSRLPWLALNLFTAASAASVVLLFGDAIERLWYLAFIMPIVAGMGGNSGTQALAVTVRRIAVASGPLEPKRDAVAKEGLVALVNGAVTGLLAFGVAFVAVTVNDQLPPLLPWVVLGALWGTVLIAGLIGAVIPTVLNKLGVDPAVASSVFLTTLTDLFGFLVLLGLATAFLL